MTVDPLDDRVGADREYVKRKGLAGFVREAWRHVDPHPLTWGWHMDAMCEHLQALARREIRDLVINVPPGMSKSITASVLYPAWVWGPGNDPAHRWIMASYSERVLLRDARKMRTLIGGQWYRDRWPDVRIPTDASASTAAGVYFTTRGGMRYSATVRGSVTGDHADTVGVDDPIDPMGASASSGTELDAVLEWWTGTMPTRYRDHATSARFLIMQRVHERDLTVEFVRAGATVLCLPMRFERSHPHRYARDPRTVEGELLCSARIPEVAVDKLETTLGPTRAAAQLHVGAVVPAGWPGLEVEVRRLPVGRPRTAPAMTGAELAQAREALGMGLRELARALGTSDKTLRRYESGERAVPMEVATAVLALTSSAAETPCKSTPYQGFRPLQVFSAPPPVATGGFGRTESTAPLQGVSAAPDPDDGGGAGGGKPRRARRLDLRVILGESPAHAPAPLARSEDGRGSR